MPDRGFLPHAVPGWRLTAILLATMTAVAGHLAWDAERKNGGLRNELAQMRARLAEKREVIARQRQEMTEVAMAVDRLAMSSPEFAAKVFVLMLEGKLKMNPEWPTVTFTFPGLKN